MEKIGDNDTMISICVQVDARQLIHLYISPIFYLFDLKCPFAI